MQTFYNCPKCKKLQSLEANKLCQPCNQQLLERKQQIASKVEKGRAKETCGICRSCGEPVSGTSKELVGGKYAHAIIPQSLIKKTDIIILRFLTIVYTSAFQKELNADTLSVNDKILETCEFIKDKICTLTPDTRDDLKDIYGKLIGILENDLREMICPLTEMSSSSSSIQISTSTSSSTAPLFFLPPRFVNLKHTTGIDHISKIMGGKSMERFGIGKQCNACEELQGDDSVIIRHDKCRIEKGFPPTFVGNKCLELIGGNTVRGFIWKWLQTDSESDEMCVLNDLFYRIGNPESAATKVLKKLKTVFSCFYSLHMIALADGFSLHEEKLDDMLALIQPKLPTPPKTKESEGSDDD